MKKASSKIWIGLISGLILLLMLAVLWSTRKHWNPTSPCFVPQNDGFLTIGAVPAPEDFRRDAISPEKFGAWLRERPLKTDNTLRIFDGTDHPEQCRHYGILDIDRGERDLQQCADAVIRLRSEFLLEKGRESEIAFNFTSGDRAYWTEWKRGQRCEVKNDKVRWFKGSGENDSYQSFREFMDLVFTYAGTASLEKELVQIPTAEMEVGDVFIFGGHPGHAMIVADMATNPENGEKMFMLVEGSTPAQDLHILKNLENPALSPWFPVEFGERLVVPGNTFYPSDLHRFPDQIP